MIGQMANSQNNMVQQQQTMQQGMQNQFAGMQQQQQQMQNMVGQEQAQFQGGMSQMQGDFNQMQQGMDEQKRNDRIMAQMSMMDQRVTQDKAFQQQMAQREAMKFDILKGQDSNREVTRDTGRKMARTSEKQMEFERRKFKSQDSNLKRLFGRNNAERRRNRRDSLIRNLARRHRKIIRSHESKQVRKIESESLNKKFRQAVKGRRVLRQNSRKYADRIITVLRNQSREQRKLIRAAERRRDAKERAWRLEALSRRSEQRLSREIAEKNKSKQVACLMEGLVKRQNEFLSNVSRRLRSWTKVQRKMTERHQGEFRRFHSKLNGKIRRLQDELQDRE